MRLAAYYVGMKNEAHPDDTPRDDRLARITTVAGILLILSIYIAAVAAAV